jgi:phosphatidate cytidylyltransferase
MTAHQPRASSDLPTRIAIGLVMIAAASLMIYFGGVTIVGGWIFRITVGLVAAFMLIEWSDLHRVPRAWAYAGGALLVPLLIVASELFYPAGEKGEVLAAGSFIPVWYALAAIAGLGLALALATRRPIMLTGVLYVGVPAFALMVLEWVWFGLTFWAMIVTWATDIFAYFTGRQIGGPKLAPRISPNKTWSGLIGGIAAAGLFGWAAAWFFDLGMPFLAIGAILAIVAQAGDLYESWVKRRAGVKDSGTILPGHGGLLDRLDGLLPVLVVTLALLMAGFWAG